MLIDADVGDPEGRAEQLRGDGLRLAPRPNHGPHGLRRRHAAADLSADVSGCKMPLAFRWRINSVKCYTTKTGHLTPGGVRPSSQPATFFWEGPKKPDPS